MKIQPTLIAIATSLVFASNFAAAESKHERHDRHERHEKHGRPQHPIKAPEISMASGTVPIALLAGVLLLMGEKIRTRRS